MQKNSEQYLLTVILLFTIAAPTATADTNDTELAQTILEKADWNVRKAPRLCYSEILIRNVDRFARLAFTSSVTGNDSQT